MTETENKKDNKTNEINILRCIDRIKVKVGILLLTSVLKGYKNTSTIRTDIDNNSYFGILEKYDIKNIRKIIVNTISRGYLEIYEIDNTNTKLKPRLLRLTKDGKNLIEHETKQNHLKSSIPIKTSYDKSDLAENKSESSEMNVSSTEIQSKSSKNKFPPLSILMSLFCDCGNSMLPRKKIKENVKYFYCITCNNYYDAQGNKFHSLSDFQKYYDFERKKALQRITKQRQTDYDNKPFISDGKINIFQKFRNDNIFYLDDYYSIRKCKSKKQLESHNVMIDVKNNKEIALSAFTPILRKILKKDVNFVICVIPSSKEGLVDSSTRSIAKELCGNNILDGTKCLVRKHTMIEKHHGGDRDINKEINSLELKNKEIIKDQLVLLLDDITTTGTSLNAGIQILTKGGARKVVALALENTF